jgi:hypothetical protein
MYEYIIVSLKLKYTNVHHSNKIPLRSDTVKELLVAQAAT